jgi:hypothetical protein
MQKQTSIYIPKPCHEDWNKMTPTQQGKFCSACSKQVIDFSLMSDNQIINVLSNQSEKLCGRFDVEQLQRPLIETKIKKKKSWWMALTMPLLFLFEKSEAQDIKILKDTPYYEMDTTVFMGAVASIAHDKQIIVKGKVVDENNEPVPFAAITEKGTKNAIAADANGFFTISIKGNTQEIILTGSAVGLETTDQKINFSQDSTTIVMMRMSRALAGDVVVTAGGISACRRVKTLDTVHATAKRLFGTAMFKLYPNPVVNSGLLNIQIRNAGNYQMQLLDNQSRLVQAEEINVDANNATTQIQLLSSIAAGIYYLRLMNEQTKKQYTEKLIIQ